MWKEAASTGILNMKPTRTLFPHLLICLCSEPNSLLPETPKLTNRVNNKMSIRNKSANNISETWTHLWP